MTKKTDFLHGLATGIGSMPHEEAEPALELIRKTLPYGPHWPQLPERGSTESFVRQYLTPLQKLEIINTEEGGTPFFYDQQEDWIEKEERFYQLYLQLEEELKTARNVESNREAEDPLSFFAFPRDSASGFYRFLEEGWADYPESPRFLKGHISGPLSVGLGVNAADGTNAFYKPNIRDILTKTLCMVARFQVRALSRFSVPVVLFIDEPALLAYGQSSYVSLSKDDIAESLGQVVSAVKNEGAYCGVHSCSGVDWSIFFDLPVDIVNFDAYSYFDSLVVYTEQVEAFLQQGGCLAWGLVPTSEAIEKEDVASLKARYYEGVERLTKRGVTKELLMKQFLLTPSCGAGTLTIPQTEKVYSITSALQKELSQHLNGSDNRG